MFYPQAGSCLRLAAAMTLIGRRFVDVNHWEALRVSDRDNQFARWWKYATLCPDSIRLGSR